jgi:hypothetical protein
MLKESTREIIGKPGTVDNKDQEGTINNTTK